MLKQIDHLGIAVHSMEKARPFYENVLKLTCEKVEGVASQKVRPLIHEIPITGAGNKQIAFLHPKSCNGVLTEFCSGAQQ